MVETEQDQRLGLAGYQAGHAHVILVMEVENTTAGI